MSNKHFFIIGISGSGKSYSAKYLAMQALFSENPRIYILDPNAEYMDICNSLDGANIEISRDSENCINVFELNGQSLGDKFLNLLTVFDIITGGLSEAQKGVLNEVLPRAYASRGIYADDPATWSKPPPIFTDVHRELNELYEYYSKRGRRSAQDLKRSIEVLINRVGMYTESGFFGFLDKQTRINIDNRFLNFDLSNLPSAVKPLVMFAVMDFVSKEIKKDRKPKVLLIDEGWALLRSKEAENYLFEFVKTSRKYGASIGFITQEIEDLLGSDTGRSILNMTSTKILMRQSSSSIELIKKSMRLNDNESDFLLRCRKGHGLLITEKEHFKFFTKASDRIHALITTDPREVKDPKKRKQLVKMQEQKEEMQEVMGDKAKMIGQISEAGKKSEVFQPTDSWYPVKGLSEEQKKTLLGLGFVAINTTKHGQGGNTKYLVKPRKNESALHHFVCKVVEEVLKGYTTEIVLNFSTEPDVVAKINGKTLAFEVETGTALVRGDKRVEEKFDRVKENYPVYFIVVTDRLQKNKYKKYGTVITRQEMVPTIKRTIAQLRRA
jgi:type IV secretory pathway VirB4 component